MSDAEAVKCGDKRIEVLENKERLEKSKEKDSNNKIDIKFYLHCNQL